MRHGKTFNKLGRTAPHRRAMLSNMASSLIIHKRITTTIAKAKALRMYIEPLITKAKEDSTHSRRTVFSYLKSKDSVRELFGPVAEKIADRPGGYTRILKLMNRKGDNAEMAIMELVDFNEAMLNEKATKGKGATKRTRRGKKAGDKVEATAKTETAAKEDKEPKAEKTEKAPKAPKAKKEDKADDTGK